MDQTLRKWTTLMNNTWKKWQGLNPRVTCKWTVVLNDGESNQHTYKTETDYWTTEEKTFVKVGDGCYYFPLITVTTLFQVEISRRTIPEALKERISKKKDARSNLFETASTCLKYGIDHSLLPEIYCNLVVSPDEKPTSIWCPRFARIPPSL